MLGTQLIVLALITFIANANVQCRGGRWVQQTPLLDRSITRVPTPFAQDEKVSPTLKATWILGHDDVTADVAVHQKDCRGAVAMIRATSSEVKVADEKDNFSRCTVEVPDNSVDVGVAAAILEQWRHVHSTILPFGSLRFTVGAQLDLFFTIAAAGRAALVLPLSTSPVTLLCPLELILPQYQADTFHVHTVLPITIRATHPEVALVARGLQLSNTMVHMKPKGAPTTTIPADVDEVQINKEGLVLRVAFAGDMLMVPLTAECRALLGHTATRVTWTPPEDAFSDDDQYPLCVDEWRRSLDAVKRKIIEGFRCSPLPCLNVNALYNVSRIPGARTPVGASLPIDADVFGGIGKGYLGGVSQATASLAMRVAEALASLSPTAGNAVKASLSQEMDALLVTLSSAFHTDPILHPRDIHTLGDTFVEVRVDHEELSRRGFLLPSVRHVCWWLHEVVADTQALLPLLSNACGDAAQRGALLDAWRSGLSRKELGGVDQPVPRGGSKFSEATRFHIKFDPASLWTFNTNYKKSTASGGAPHQYAPFTMGARWIVQALDVTVLPNRGLDITDLRVPHPSLRYQVSHPQHGHGERWVRADGMSLTPLTLDCLSGSNRTEYCPGRLGVIADHLEHGWEAALDAHVRENSLFLVCPPASDTTPRDGVAVGSTCGEQYYGKYEAVLATWVRREWITSIERNDVNKKVFSFVFGRMPEHVVQTFVGFGKPLHVVVQPPARLAVDDHRHLFGRGTVSGSRGGVFGFVLLPYNAPADTNHVRDEL